METNKKNKQMQAVRSKNTKIELAVSKALWIKGIRFRKNVKDLFGKPDIAIKRYKIAVFIDSCFWHGCPFHCRMPKKNLEFWENKINRNRERDKEVTKYYLSNNWKIIRIWEHQLIEDFNGVINNLLGIINVEKTKKNNS